MSTSTFMKSRKRVHSTVRAQKVGFLRVLHSQHFVLSKYVTCMIHQNLQGGVEILSKLEIKRYRIEIGFDLERRMNLKSQPMYFCFWNRDVIF